MPGPPEENRMVFLNKNIPSEPFQPERLMIRLILEHPEGRGMCGGTTRVPLRVQ